MSEKKPSLFKQRMKQLAANGQQPAQEVFKLETLQPPMEIEKHAKTEETQKQSEYRPLLRELERSNMLSHSEYQDISKHNDEYLQSLSEGEIKQMQAQLQQELSPDFLGKLFKTVHEAPLNVAQQPTEPQQIEVEKTAENANQHASVEVEEPEKEELHQAICQRMNRLCINPTNGELSYSEEECPANLVNIHLIYLMVTSGNNQSLVSGLKVLGQMLTGLKRVPQTYGVTVIGPYYWNLRVLFDFIGASIVGKIVAELIGNSFKTCRLQCIETLLVYYAVGGLLDSGLLAQLKAEAIQNQKQVAFPAELLEAKPTLQVSIWRKMQSPHCAQTLQELSLLLNSPAILIEKLMIEHAYYLGIRSTSELAEMQHYYNDLLQQLTTYPENNRKAELDNAVTMLYLIVKSCALKLKIHEEVVVRSFLKRFGATFQRFLEWVLDRSQHSLTIYRVLLCLKKSSKLHYIKLLHSIQQGRLCRTNFNTVEPILCLLNLKEYAQQKQESDKELINRMLAVVGSWMLYEEQDHVNAELILLSLLRIFRLPEDTYQNLEQQLLQSTFEGVCNKINTTVLYKIVEEHMAIVKKLVDCYNFNSFGSLVFSKLLIFLASNSMPLAAQTYIVIECFQRYPFIFYEAGKTPLYGLKTNDQLYSFSLRAASLQVELSLVAKMLEGKEKEIPENGFLRLLR